MTKITLTKENFGKKMSFIYEKMILKWKIRINLEENNKELLWTEYEEKAYNEAKKNFLKWDIIDWKDMFKNLLWK